MEQKQRNGLEVTCIGSLYQGPWEKKYWSSSRGKDRYPYPVGFHAVRCYNGQTYQMEIHEGPRGPLFVVSSGEEITCSGDTPTIAWENAIKKLNIQPRKVQQRLLNACSDASELFGFSNPLVQRLFRELVSSQCGEAHQSCKPFEAMSQDRNEINQEKQATGSDESRTVSINLSWGSTKMCSVRKSRTSILKSRNPQLTADGSENSHLLRETKKPSTCRKAADDTLSPSPLEDQEDISHLLRFRCPSGGSKRLKLPKSTKLTEQSSPSGNLSCSTLQDPARNTPSPDSPVPQSDSEKYGSEQDGNVVSEVNSSSDMKRQKLDSSLLGVNASKAVSLETMAVIVPDSLENLSSQIPQRGMEQILSPFPHSSIAEHGSKNMLSFLDFHMNTFPEDIFMVPDTFEEHSQVYKKKRGKNQELQGSSKTLPVLEKNLDMNMCPENKTLDSNQWVGEKLQLKTAVVLDSCDHNNLLVPSKDARKSTGVTTTSSEGSLEGIPVDNMLSNDTTQSNLGAAITSQGLQEQIPVDTHEGQCHDSKIDNTQKSEDNMDKCDSDSLGQEITKSMITLLLPQALQLLEKKRKRKIKSIIPSSINESHMLPDAINQHNDVFDTTKQFVHQNILGKDVNLSIDRSDGEIKDEYNMVKIGCPQHSENCGCNYSVNRTSNEAEKSSSLQCITGEDLVLLDHDDQYGMANRISKDANIADLIFSCKDDDRPSEIQETLGRNLEGHVKSLANEMLPQASKDVVGAFKTIDSEDLVRPEPENSLRSQCGEVCPSADLDHVLEPFTNFKSNRLDVNDAVCQKRTFTQLPTTETIERQESDFETLLCSSAVPKRKISSPGPISELPCPFSEYKRQLLQSNNFEPKVCLEHPMQVLAMKVHVQDDDIRFFSLCGYPNRKSRILFLYRVMGKEVKFSLINSIDLNVLECGCDASYFELVESNGICFTPDGEYLVVLGTVSINRARDHADTGSGIITRKTKPHHGVQLVSYTNPEASVLTELSPCGWHAYSLLVCDPYTVIAGGEKGYVSGWKMDSKWRNCKEKFILPGPEGHQLSHVIQLLAVSNCPSLVVGCDDLSLMAIWNICSRQLLRTSTYCVSLPLEVHILDMNVMNQKRNNQSKINTSSIQRVEETGDGITVSLLFGTVDQNDRTSVSPTLQCISRTWTLQIFQQDGNTRVFHLDMDQRFSAMSIMDRLGIAGTHDGYVYLWDTATGSVRQAFKDFGGVPIECVASNWGCDVILVADANARVMAYMKQESI